MKNPSSRDARIKATIAPMLGRGKKKPNKTEKAAAADRSYHPTIPGEHDSRGFQKLLIALKRVKKGDFGVRLTGDRFEGVPIPVVETFNDVIELNEKLATEFRRISQVVGKEGKIAHRAEISGLEGAWAASLGSVNTLITDLVQPTNEVARVIGAVLRGDLSQTMDTELEGEPIKGEFLRLSKVVNTMVNRLGAFASEVTRVAREVGTEGKLGGQAKVEGVSGTWKDLTDSVNLMASNLTGQVRNIAEVTTAVAKGDLSKKITVDVKGEILELKNTINTMVDQLNAFASEVIRVAREVGTEGRLGGQATVKGVAGAWKDLTDNVNLMANNLTGQVRNIAEVTTAVATGDLSKKITVDVRGEILELKNTINTMVDQLNAFASEVTRVAREVGTEGKLGGQATVGGVAGTWKDLTDSVNLMANNLTAQVRNIAEVTTAVAQGDLSKKITVNVKGEILELKNTINTMVDQLSGFASEVIRVAREVGTEGKLGGQATVKGVAGAWKDLTDNVNIMASNLTGQVRNIAEVTTAVAMGDLSKKITVDVRGEILRLKETINTMVDQLRSFASEVTRVAREVGTEGKLGGQARVEGVAGTWKDLTDNVNLMASNLTAQVRNIAEVTTAVALGDLSKKITVDVKGEILELKNTINTMVDQLNAFASEVTRVAREVGTDGKLGGQATVKGVSGTWKDLTDNVNFMASNLTSQVRGIAKVVTAVATGDLKQKLAFEAKGEIAALADTINEMIDTLGTFGDQVTSVAREVGVEGRLGGQAKVPGAAGLWRDLTDNVNQLAANLTNQVRAIADVATAVTKGDLTRSIAVEAKGEVEVLKDNINEMIRNLKETTQKNQEQDWLKTNLAKFTQMLQGQRDMLTVAKLILSELAPLVNAQHGVFFLVEEETLTDVDDAERAEKTERGEKILKLLGSFAYRERISLSNRFKVGEGLVGQCALEKERILLSDVPGNYIRINSGLGEAPPVNIVVLPVLFEGEVRAVIELASFQRFNEIHIAFLDQLTESIGIVLNTIAASMRTEDLLKKSQSLTQDLQSQQEKLQKTNEELEDKAKLLAEQKSEVEKKNIEVEQTKQALEEKAEQLSLTSKYKSEFLANMSHELRTPLNSLLILAKMLSENTERNLSGKQVEYAKTIHGAGTDLLALISEILDLSKIEAGKMAVDVTKVHLSDLKEEVDRNFSHLAHTKRLTFAVEIEKGIPASISTDTKRLQQVIKNLLSNAFKFTERGGVTLRVGPAKSGWSFDHRVLSKADTVIAFSVTDTGIGIPQEKQQLIFEAFQQADGTTSRKYGGTGLGLSISREIALLLGGEIRVTSQMGKGSTFTFFLPDTYSGSAKAEPKRTIRAVPRDFLPKPPSFEEIDPETLDLTIEALHVEDDRETISAGDRTLLVIDDDPNFSQILLDIGRENGFKGVVSLTGENTIVMAKRYKPSAILLDVKLPDIEGWVVLDRLKHDDETRHIPVFVLSGKVGKRKKALKLGAYDYIEKPVTKDQLSGILRGLKAYTEKRTKQLLIIEDDDTQRDALAELVGQGGDVEVTTVGQAEEGFRLMKEKTFDGVILDLLLPDMSGFDLLQKMEESHLQVPVIVYTGADLTPDQQSRLKRSASTTIVKDANSPERILAETALILHRPGTSLPESQRNMLKDVEKIDPTLAGKSVLVVDDDVRNIFALMSVLESQHIHVSYTESGKEAIQHLKMHPDTDAVLMDIMMPEMDGYETIEAIRKEAAFKSLPIVAVTAKAMKGDRDKCIDAGATDYIAKPVDPALLFSLLRVYLGDQKKDSALPVLTPESAPKDAPLM